MVGERSGRGGKGNRGNCPSAMPGRLGYLKQVVATSALGAVG